MASPEEGPEPLKYQTLTLKVSIHCEGCKKKVKKVLHSIEGVYKTTVDSQQQKVIVIGNVEADTLIKKLLKTGKHAELWPEKKPNNPGGGGGGGGGGKKNKNKNKASGKPNEPSENPESNQTPSGDDSPPDSSANADGNAPNIGGKDSPKADNKETGNSPPSDKQNGGGGGAPAPAPGGSGGGSKKKGKKGQKENSGGGGGGGGGGEGPGVSEGMGGKPGSGGGSVVSLPAFSYGVYPTSQPPAYVVSYSTVQPSASYGGAYYPMPMNQSSYFYSTATPGSCYIFSDENANACRIM